MAIATIRHMEGSQFQHGKTLSYNEVARVTGLTAVAAGSELNIISEAITDPSMPDYGDSLGAPYATLFLIDIIVNRVSCNSSTDEPFVDFTLQWRIPKYTDVPADDNGPVIVTTGTTLESVEKFKDLNGDPIVVTYNGRNWGGTVTRLIQRKTYKVSRREVTNPRFRIDTYSGKANNAIWNGYGAGTILCGPINSTTEDDGATYNVEYEFIRREEGWEFEEVAFYDVNTDSFPTDITPGNGIEQILNVELVSFSGLNIILP